MAELTLSNIIDGITHSPKYAQIAPEVISRLAEQELPRHKKLSTAIKAARTKLHQAAGAYLDSSIIYAQITKELELIHDDDVESLIIWAYKTMRLHASTEERLSDLEDFYRLALGSILQPDSILDLACGFNPLSLPYQPGFPNTIYLACDIVLPMLDLINAFLKKINNPGYAFACDLAVNIPDPSADLALLMKTIPLLDQLNRQIVPRLLNGLKTDVILASFPLKSLGGYDKGMLNTYRSRMAELTDNSRFEVEEFAFHNEIAFLLRRKGLR